MKSARATVLAGLLAALTVLGSTGCFAHPDPGPSIDIGAIYPRTGPQGPGGLDELAGVQTALELARRHGDRFASRVNIKVVSAATPDDAAGAVDRLVAQHVPLVIGTYGSSLAEAAAARADERHTVYWETGAVADMITAGRSYVFRTVATGSTLGRTAVDFTSQVLLADAGTRPRQGRVVVLAVDDLYGRSVADEEVAALQTAGMDLLGRINYDPHAYDPIAIAREVGALGPDYLLDVSYVDDGVAIWRQLLELGVPLKAAVGTSSAFCTPEFGRALGAQAIGLFAADKPNASINPSVLSPDAALLLQEASATYAANHHGARMEISAMAGFVGGWALFHDVIPKIKGSITAESIRAAAYQVDLPRGSSVNGGGIRFAPAGSQSAGQNLLAASVVGQWQAVQTMRVVYPAGFATTEPVLPAFPRVG